MLLVKLINCSFQAMLAMFVCKECMHLDDLHFLTLTYNTSVNTKKTGNTMDRPLWNSTHAYWVGGGSTIIPMEKILYVHDDDSTPPPLMLYCGQVQLWDVPYVMAPTFLVCQALLLLKYKLVLIMQCTPSIQCPLYILCCHLEWTLLMWVIHIILQEHLTIECMISWILAIFWTCWCLI